MFKRLFGKKEENKKPAPPTAAPAPAPQPKNYAKNFPQPPTHIPISMPVPMTPDPKLVGLIDKLQLYGNVLPEKTRKLLLQFFESRIKLTMSTPFSIEYAIQEGLNRSIVEKEVIFTMMRPGTRKLEDVIAPYLRPGIALDKDVYETVYKLLIEQHLQQKTKNVYGVKGGRRKTLKRKQKHKKSKKTRKH